MLLTPCVCSCYPDSALPSREQREALIFSHLRLEAAALPPALDDAILRPDAGADGGQRRGPQRRRLLDYLKRKDTDRYAELIRRLGIRK